MNLPADRREWPEGLRELYEERAGILEFEANFPRWKAEAMAEQDIRRSVSDWEMFT